MYGEQISFVAIQTKFLIRISCFSKPITTNFEAILAFYGVFFRKLDSVDWTSDS